MVLDDHMCMKYSVGLRGRIGSSTAAHVSVWRCNEFEFFEV